MILAECNDRELLDGLKKNYISAFNTIYQKYSKPLYIYLLHKLKEPEICNDVLQDIFVALWEKRHGLKIDTSLKAYLYQCARYKIIDIYRKDEKYQKYLSELAEYMFVDQTSIVDRIDNRNKLTEIEAAVKNLPDKMREIFILSRYEHQTTSDIASKTNLSPQTVKNQLSKALRILRVNNMSVDVVFLFVSILIISQNNR